jgi:predicted Zn-ribbon and HTH transcriptional regulator
MKDWRHGIKAVVKEGIKGYYDMLKVFNLECPDCGTELTDNRINAGSHKGYGSIFCPKCNAVKVWI